MSQADQVIRSILGRLAFSTVDVDVREPHQAWARSGAMWLTGRENGPPLPAPGNPAGVAEALLQLWATRSQRWAGRTPRSPNAALLGERACILGLGRHGSATCSGAGRMLPASDGYVAVSLARPDDIELVHPLTGMPPADDPWRVLATWLRSATVQEAVERARSLGVPVGAVPGPTPTATRSGVVARRGGARRKGRTPPRVVDLSALWAGPLAAHLLGLAGAEVIKVESPSRPDGTRRGPARFFDLLHGGHKSVSLDLDREREALVRLLRSADLVLSSSRPRAMAQLGIEIGAVVDDGVSWVAITSHGMTTDAGRRVGFGDDVAASAGLVARDDAGPVFCGDALADPLTGITAAAAAATVLGEDTAWLVDVSMYDVCLATARASAVGDRAEVPEAVRPTARMPVEAGPELGEHTAGILAGLRG